MEHLYQLYNEWTGNTGMGTSSYRGYQRSYRIEVKGKPDLKGSADAMFRGDKSLYNPEDLLLAALSACHMLSYLHVCAEAGVVVISYKDFAEGKLVLSDGGRSGKFSEVILNPKVEVLESSMCDKANELHSLANQMCFIANSCNFPVKHKPECSVSRK